MSSVTKKSNKIFYLKSLWFIAFISGLTFVLQDIEILRTDPIQVSIIHKSISHLILGLFVCFQLLKRPSIIFKDVILIFVFFCGWCFLSTFWSIYPTWTLYRSLEYFIFISLVAYTAFSLKSFKELKEIVDFIWFLIGLLIISVWVGILVFPDEAMQPSRGLIPFILHGAFPRLNANTVSHIGGIISIVGLSRLFSSRKKKWILLVLLGIATMILAQGRSGILGFVIAALFLLFFHKKISLLLMVTILIFILIGYTQIDVILYRFILRGQTQEVIWGLSGRMYKWEHAKTFILDRPFLGYGAFAGSRFLVMPEITGPLSSSTHNAWVELTVEVGLIGVILYILSIFLVIFNLFRFIFKFQYINNNYLCLLIEMLCVMLLLIVRSIFTTAVLITPYDFAFLIVLVSTLFFRKIERVKSFSPNLLK